MSDSAMATVELPDARAVHFSALLDCLYGGTCTVERAHLSELVQLASRMQASWFQELLEPELAKDVTVSTFVEALDFAERLCLPTLREIALSIAAQTVSQLTAKGASITPYVCSRLVELSKLSADYLHKLATSYCPSMLVDLCKFADNAEVVELIIAAGVDVNRMFRKYDANSTTQEYASSPLFEAAYVGAERIVDALIQAGATVDAKDSEGNSPLFIASQEGYCGVVERLLEGEKTWGLPAIVMRMR